MKASSDHLDHPFQVLGELAANPNSWPYTAAGKLKSAGRYRGGRWRPG